PCRRTRVTPSRQPWFLRLLLSNLNVLVGQMNAMESLKSGKYPFSGMEALAIKFKDSHVMTIQKWTFASTVNSELHPRLGMIRVGNLRR
ncbi:hypothetical protein, partial [Propionivibrio sp.]|uniref:hypothetical protein n=1 Tax=Propionivibrio sp. TaxID=2212460 RepID=UPI00260B05B7